MPQFGADSVAKQEFLQIYYSFLSFLLLLLSCLRAGLVLQHTTLKKNILRVRKKMIIVFPGLCEALQAFFQRAGSL